jgi:preprotein translocase subunit SecG
MFALFTVLIVIVCILLILVVLVQNSKGGGLASNFSSAGQFMGVRKTTDFLEKATWSLSVALVVLSIIATAVVKRGGEEQKSLIQDQIQNTGDQATPSFPNAAPAQGEQPAQGDAQPAQGDAQQQPAQGGAQPSTDKK